MSLLLAAAGIALITVTVADVLITTVSVGSGAGPITRRLSDTLWRAARRLRPGSHRVLRTIGTGVMLVSILVWLLLAWAGWTLVFSAGERAVVDAVTGAPGTLWDRIYFTGYTLLTLGNGDFRPGGAPWQIATVFAVANGFLLITLAITYLVPLASAATQKRQVAAYITSLGDTPDRILTSSFDGEGFSTLSRQLPGLAERLFLHEQRHHTYPLLHYFHSVQRSTAAPPSLAALDEALTLLEAGVAPGVERPTGLLVSLRRALTAYLDTVADAYVSPAPEPPPAPQLGPLRAAGIPTVGDDTFARRVAELDDRRRLLLGLVQHDGWEWADVTGGEREPDPGRRRAA